MKKKLRIAKKTWQRTTVSEVYLYKRSLLETGDSNQTAGELERLWLGATRE